MIDWGATLSEFGYRSLPISKRPKVICTCDNCSKKRTIAVRVKSNVVDNQMQWLCPSCVKLRESDIISARMTKQWKDPEYISERQSSSSDLWQDAEYRSGHSKAVKQAMKSVDMTSMLKKRYEDPAEREKHRKISLELFSTPEFIKKHKRAMARPEVRAKCSQGAKFAWERPEYRELMAQARSKMLGSVSGIQKILYDLLDDLGIGYYKEGPETKIGYYVFDCLAPKQGSMHKHLLIECQGDYWHSLPKAIRNDKSKFTYIDRYFPEHEIMYVWEHEFYAKDRVLDRLKLKLGIDIETIDFSINDVQVRVVSSSDIKSFLDVYHYIGKGRGGRCFGAYYKDKLIACVVFSSPLRQNTAGQFNLADGDVRELSRLCIHPSYHKKNFASWLIAKTTKEVDCKLVVAYADTTVGHTGTIYKASNFELHHTVPSDYWYVDGDGFVMHKCTLYKRAQSAHMIESEFARTKGYIKKYGGEKLCFVRKINAT